MQPPTENERKPNRLIYEKSLYLQQHANNPVDWYPWGQEAFEKAKVENKPIFLSIGYSSCHWCHVMEKECFEDQEVAALLNKAFICIKVDREERPDLDSAYMLVCQEMGRNCGWPLHILMTPKLNPFFAASYIPKFSTRGPIGMMDLIPQVADIWRLRKNELEILGVDIKSRIEAIQKRTPETELGTQILQDAYEKLKIDFDPQNGGFGSAPKFPRPHSLIFLLRYWKRTKEEYALFMVENTLRKMRLGGIFDQIGFGFHRYSTDATWLVPHFEKMLYDQALLSLAYIEAFEATGKEKFALTAKETLDYVLRDLASPQGGYFSAEDADSEGEEGKYYLWTLDEILEILEPTDADLAVHLFGLSAKGNYQIDSGMGNKKNILHLSDTMYDLAATKGMSIDELIARLGKIRNALFEARKNRKPPIKDNKFLTDWNGLIIAALAKASIVFNEKRFLHEAIKTSSFFLGSMRSDDGRLFHRFAEGERAVEGFLDDYAFLVLGLIEMYEASFDEKYLKEALNLTRIQIEKFWDENNGGFFFTQKGTQGAMPRLKHAYDGALPSGNSVALFNLLRLSRLANDQSLEEKAKELIKTFSEEVQSAPTAYTWLLSGVDFAVGPSLSVLLVGELEDKETANMLIDLRNYYLPNMVIKIRKPDKNGLGFDRIESKTTAYVCRDQTCLPPTNSIEKMRNLIQNL